MAALEDQFKNEEGFSDWQKGQTRGRVAAGILVILAGLIYLFKQMGYGIPDYVFTWPVLLIAVGIVAIIKNNFKNAKGLVLVVIGALFLAAHSFPEIAIIQYKIPIILFIIGLILLFRPKNRHHEYSKFCHNRSRFSNPNRYSAASGSTTADSEDYISANNIFGSTDKNIFSKDFKGGEIRNTFGGCKLNLMQAEIVNEAVLTIRQQFGGVKLIIPPNWVIKSDIDCVFAGIEDKRPLMNVKDTTQAKTLILNGHIFMSGIEIVSY